MSITHSKKRVEADRQLFLSRLKYFAAIIPTTFRGFEVVFSKKIFVVQSERLAFALIEVKTSAILGYLTVLKTLSYKS